jgi:DNA-binding beta-propeller fold protein YncE
VTQPRIAAFARMANGNVKPGRVIAGQATKLGRTIHGIAYDPQHDEIVVPNALADAVLVFRAGANGAEPPLRVIQGPRTQLVTPHSVNLDLDHGEILVGSVTGRSIWVFPRDARGDVAPRRVIKGPKTRLRYVVGLAVDPVTDLLAVANGKEILVFNRTDNGDVAPRAIIAGPKTGIGDEPWQLRMYGGRIFLAASNHLHHSLYDGVVLKGTYTEVPEDPWLDPDLGFIGVWSITDNGDTPPSAIIKGPFSGILHPVGLALNPKHGEIYVSDSVRNGVFTFLVPNFFTQVKEGTPRGALPDSRRSKPQQAKLK